MNAPVSKPVRVTTLADYKKSAKKIAALTAYDATMAALLDRAGVDVLLVGDSLGTVIMGEPTTIPVTMDAMVHHTRAVTRGARRALVVADLPFLSYHTGVSRAIRNAGRLIQEGGAAAVKLEGKALAAIRGIADAGIPVMAHLGLLPQSVHQTGGYVKQGRSEADAQRIIDDAHAVTEAGVFAVVLECIPASLAQRITSEISIPTIGIGAGPHCDGQVLVSYDALGLFAGPVPSFVKQYARLGELAVEAAQAYVEDVREGRYPNERGTN